MIDLQNYLKADRTKNEIYRIYQSQLEEFPIELRQHFLVRANVAGLCGSDQVRTALEEYSKKVNRGISRFYKKEYGTMVDSMADVYLKSPGPRKRKIGKYFRDMENDSRICKILAMYVLAESVDIFIRTGNSDLIELDRYQECYLDSIDTIEEFMSEEDFLDKHFIKAVVTYTNLWWYLRNYADDRKLNPSGRRIRKTIMDKIRKFLTCTYTTGTGDMESIVYGITHVVIGATRFYTRTLPSEFCGEIGILAGSIQRPHTEDITLETALCLKLSRMPQYQQLVAAAVRNARLVDVDGTQIVQNYEMTGNTLDDLMRNEHTNSLYLLCL